MREVFFLFLKFTFIPFFLRKLVQRSRLTIITYHKPDKEKFREHLQWLSKNYTIVALSDVIDIFYKSSFRKLPKRSLVITFDDGHASNYELLGSIKEYAIKPTVFLCSGIVDTNRHFWFLCSKMTNSQSFKEMQDKERLEALSQIGFHEQDEYSERQALNSREIHEMSAYVDFQSHTITHPILTQCDDDKSYKEIALSKKDLETKYNFLITSFAYPNGNYSEREITYLKQAGYLIGVSSDVGYNTSKTNQYALKRMPLPDGCSLRELEVKVSGFWFYTKG